MKALFKYPAVAATLIAAAVALAISCADTGGRLNRIQQQLEGLRTQVAALDALRAAAGQGDELIHFSPIVENGAIVAYKAVFSKAGEVTVANGSHIISVTEDAASVIFTLADGSQIVIPKPQALTIALEGDQTAIGAGETITVAYLVEGAADALVTVLCGSGWSATVTTADQEAAPSTTSGTITVTAPTPIAQDKVIVFASDSKGRLVAAEMRLTIDTSGNPSDPPTPPGQETILLPVHTVYDVSNAGGEIEVGVIANVEYTVTTDATWLHYNGTKAVRTDNLSFLADANDNLPRTATATFTAGNYSTGVRFRQAGTVHYLNISDTYFRFDDTGGTATLSVGSDLPYTCSTDAAWVTVELTSSGEEDDYLITVESNAGLDARTATVTIDSERMGTRTVTIAQSGRYANPVPHSCIPVCYIMPCCRVNNAGTKFWVADQWDSSHQYYYIHEVRSILQHIKDAGINVIGIDFTNASQWDDVGQSALHNGDGGEFWQQFKPMLDNIVQVCAEKDMKYFLFIGGTLAATTKLDYWNFIAGVILERWASDPNYLKYGYGDDRPMLVMFMPGTRLASQLRSAPASQKNNLLQFHLGSCQVNSAITPTTTDGWGYRNYLGSSDGKVRFACPNGGVPPQDWYRVDAAEWRSRVAWALEATEYAVLGSYDDTCDAIFWGIADVSRSNTPSHRNAATENDPYLYYNIVRNSLK